MNRNELIQYHSDFCKKMAEVVAAKNNDYAGEDFAFANFCQIEVDGLCSTEVGLWTRFRDKTARLLNFIKGGTLKVKDEKIEDTILDACNYLIILSGYIKYKRALETPKFDYPDTATAHKYVHATRSFQAGVTSPEVQFDPWNCEEKEEVWNTDLGPIQVTYGATR